MVSLLSVNGNLQSLYNQAGVEIYTESTYYVLQVDNKKNHLYENFGHFQQAAELLGKTNRGGNIGEVVSSIVDIAKGCSDMAAIRQIEELALDMDDKDSQKKVKALYKGMSPDAQKVKILPLTERIWLCFASPNSCFAGLQRCSGCYMQKHLKQKQYRGNPYVRFDEGTEVERPPSSYSTFTASFRLSRKACISLMQMLLHIVHTAKALSQIAPLVVTQTVLHILASMNILIPDAFFPARSAFSSRWNEMKTRRRGNEL